MAWRRAVNSITSQAMNTATNCCYGFARSSAFIDPVRGRADSTAECQEGVDQGCTKGRVRGLQTWHSTVGEVESTTPRYESR